MSIRKKGLRLSPIIFEEHHTFGIVVYFYLAKRSVDDETVIDIYTLLNLRCLTNDELNVIIRFNPVLRYVPISFVAFQSLEFIEYHHQTLGPIWTHRKGGGSFGKFFLGHKGWKPGVLFAGVKQLSKR